MSSKAGEGKSGEGKVSSSGSPSARSTNLIKKLTKQVIKGMSKLRFKEWFTEEEVDQFRDNADLSRMEPLFHRWQDKMEELLTHFASQEGLESPGEIISALEECRSNTGDWITLNNLISSMTEKEVRPLHHKSPPIVLCYVYNLSNYCYINMISCIFSIAAVTEPSASTSTHWLTIVYLHLIKLFFKMMQNRAEKNYAKQQGSRK